MTSTHQEYVQKLREILQAVQSVFPTDDELVDAGYAPEQVDAACDVYRKVIMILEQPAVEDEDGKRYRFVINAENKTFAVCWRDGEQWVPCLTNGPIDVAMTAAQNTKE